MRGRRWLVLISVVGLAASLTFAQPGSAPTVQVILTPRFGNHLADNKGDSLYIYTKDAQGPSTCTGDCASNWPPLLVTRAPVAGKGVTAALLGTTKRPDGSLQVTYNGWPLYTYVRDDKPGAHNGEALGGMFFFLDPLGKAITKEQPEKKVQISQAAFDALMNQGQDVFVNNCAVCHGSNGQGKVGPRFAGNSDLSDTSFVLTTVLYGVQEHGMPTWKDTLTDAQIAAVTTFIRNSWSNQFGAVTPEEVKSAR